MEGRRGGGTAPLSRRLVFKLVTSDALERGVRATPAGTALAWRLARRYVAGTTLDDALACARRLAAGGLAASIDMFGERVTDPVLADRVAADYRELAGRVGGAGTWLSLDLSQLGIAADAAAAERRLLSIVEALPSGVRLQIGAEEAGLADRILHAMLGAPASLTATVQANLRRSPADAERFAAAGVPIRLVKGAYVERPADALPYGEPTDLAYLRLAHRLAELDAAVSLATHDALLREACRRALPGAGVEMLLGVREDEAERLASEGVRVRVYVPYGDGWFRYFLRRAAESRGAAGVS